MGKLLLIALANLALQGVSGPHSRPVPFNSEEFAVYNAVIRKTYTRPETRRVVVEDRTEIYPFDRAELNVKKQTASIMKAFAAWAIQKETVANYFAANKAPSHLEDHFDLPLPVVLFSSKDRYNLSRDRRALDFWTIFYERYPHSTGILAVSRVGFNSTKEQAFVYVRDACGSLCGGGSYYLLSKTSGRWRIAAVLQLWMS